ncbi:hypothetical protein HK28_09520 [Acetobacter sp. DsW_063]|nr:hypothetical protein HK28_09520 [Acetobacter sp. DsW_063]
MSEKRPELSGSVIFSKAVSADDVAAASYVRACLQKRVHFRFFDDTTTSKQDTVPGHWQPGGVRARSRAK